jgi:hypothetical protein
MTKALQKAFLAGCVEPSGVTDPLKTTPMRRKRYPYATNTVFPTANGAGPQAAMGTKKGPDLSGQLGWFTHN